MKRNKSVSKGVIALFVLSALLLVGAGGFLMKEYVGYQTMTSNIQKERQEIVRLNDMFSSLNRSYQERLSTFTQDKEKVYQLKEQVRTAQTAVPTQAVTPTVTSQPTQPTPIPIQHISIQQSPIQQIPDQAVPTIPVNKGIVCLDPGHQGYWVDMSATEPDGPGSSVYKARASTGTEGNYTGTPEYDLNLAISLALEAELTQRGYQVIMTRRDNDTAISNAERAQLANQAGADAFIRIHANSSDDTSVMGAEAYVPSDQNPYVAYLAGSSAVLGQAVLDAYCETTGMVNRGVRIADNMSGINWAQVPVIILEMGYMSNETDDWNMADPSYRQSMVQGIANGVDRYFLIR